MKKIFFLLLFLLTSYFFAQPVVVTASTAEIMAKKITNIKCVTTSNWILKSGSNFAGNSNSAGLFTGNGATFPYSAGIVLSTGFVTSIPGPKIIPPLSAPQGDGTNAWTSDPDMNTFLNDPSNPFLNASSLEFTFTTRKPEFRLNYLFASNEYGVQQCPTPTDVSDAMLILLTDLTDTSIPVKNIALTATTNQIISPSKIRNRVYNSSCLDENLSSFGAFYNGQNPLVEPINFFGRTIPMTALATLDITHTYKIKIIIADRLDREYDSAVFVSNYVSTGTGQETVLGPDITAANTTLCEGLSHTINSNGVDPTATGFRWRKDGVNYPAGDNLRNLLIPASEATGTHTYQIIYSNTDCLPFDLYADVISITYSPKIDFNQPIALINCVGATPQFDLNTNRTKITQGFTGLTVTFHVDAACVTAALPDTYTGSLTTLWAKIVKTGSPCPPEKVSFTLGTLTTPVTASAPADIKVCSRGTALLNNVYNLGSLIPSILNGQSTSTHGVTFHTTPAGAINNNLILSIDGNGNGLVSNGTFGVRVFLKSNTNCFATSTFNVIVDPLLAADQLQDVVYCGTPGYKLPVLLNGKYFENPYNPLNPNSQLAEIPAGTIITIPPGINGSYTKTIYISNLVTTSAPCTQEWPFKITLIQPTTFTEVTKSFCEKYTLPPLDFGEYRTEPNGGGVIIPPGEITTTTTIHFYFKSVVNTIENPECIVPAGPITITINPKPDLGPERANVFNCSPISAPYVLPPLAVNFPGAQYFNGPNGTLGVIADGTAITASKTIYVYKKVDYLDGAGAVILTCDNSDDFEVVVGLGSDVTENRCNYKLPIQPVGNYYTEMNGGGTLIAGGTDIETSGDYFLYFPLPAGSTCDPGFTNEVRYDITLSQPIVDNIAGFDPNAPFQCGPFELPLLTNGKYYTESHLNGGTGGTEILAGTIINAIRTVYVYNFTPGSNPLCAFEKKFEFRYRALPPISARSNVFECDDPAYILPPMNALNDGTLGDYYTGPNATGQRLRTVQERTIPFSTTPLILYLYNIDPITGCENDNEIENPNDPPSLQLRRNTIIVAFPRTQADVPVNAIEEKCTSFTLPSLIVPGAKYVEYPPNFDPNIPLPPNTPAPSFTNVTNLNITIPTGFTGNVYDKTYYIYNATFYGTRPACPVNNKIQVLLYKKPDLSALASQMYFCSASPVTAGQLQTTTGKYYTKSHVTDTATLSDLIDPNTVLTDGQEVYAYELNPSLQVGSTFAGCYDEKKIKINILRIDPSSTLTGCGSVNLKPLTIGGSYYSATNGQNPVVNTTLTYDPNVTYPIDIFIYKASGFPGGLPCAFLENKVSVTITPIPIANAVPAVERTYCDDDATNDGIKEILLSIFDATIKGPSQTSSNFSVSYHSATPATTANTITNISASTTTVYAVVNNSIFTACSSQPLQLDLKVNKLPEPTPKSGIICIDNLTGLPIGNYIFDSQLAPSIHSFVWKNEAGATVGSASQLTTNTAGTYSLIATNTNVTPNCSSKEVMVKLEESSKALTGYTVSEFFTENQTIVVIVDAYGSSYEYQMDDGVFQSSNIFENVSSGLHTIVVRDVNGCGISDPLEAIIVNYVKFFTPNSDGINDTWNIKDLDLFQKNSKISIFDRQGKLLKQISTSGTGWDGTYNGRPVPADDYWFTVTYLEKGIPKEFRANFSIKR